MKSLRNIWAQLRSLGRRYRTRRDIDEELRFHIEQRTAENIAAGMSPGEAASEARKRFGNWQSVREECRERRGASWGEAVWQDVRFGCRMLLKSPGFTAVAVLSLALGIGANTAIFSLVNAVLLRGLPVPQPQQLRLVEWSGKNVQLSNFSSGAGGMNGSFPYPVFEEFRKRAAGTADVFGFASLWSLNLLGPDGATSGNGLLVSGNFFSGYGVFPLLGRSISDLDDRPEAAPVAVLGYHWWERHFGSDPQILGRSITINRHSFTIVGVLPRNFAAPGYGDTPDIYVPMAAQPQLRPGSPLGSDRHWWMTMMVRLAPGADEARLKAAFAVAFQQVLSAPGQETKMDDPTIVLADGSRGQAGTRRFFARPLLGLLALVAVVLLVACANLAGLLVARGAARRRELAVRVALGAGSGRILRQLLTETLLLALLGGGLGLLLAMWSRSLLLMPLAQMGGSLHLEAFPDGRVLGFTLAVSVLTATFAGLLPALCGARVDPARDLAGTLQTGMQRQRLGRVLVGVQMGLSTLLVVAAVLFGRSLLNLVTINPGFNPENLLVFRLDAGSGGIAAAQQLPFFEKVREQLAAIPGVRSVTLSDNSLLNHELAANGISIPGPAGGPESQQQANQLVIGEGFFATMGIPLLQGREFTMHDDAPAPRVVVVNRQFVRSFLADGAALGKSFRIGDQAVEIVGVCGDAKYTELRQKIEPTMYLPFRQNSRGGMYFEIRSALPPLSLVPGARQAVAAVDRNIPLSRITTQAELSRQSIFLDRLATLLCGLLALLALGLTCIGLYGLMAFHVARHTREIGVRMALGATPGMILRTFLGQALRTACWGLAGALPVALALALSARASFYGITPGDPLIYVAAAAVLLSVAALAAWIPARRAARVNPMEALRWE